MTKEYFITVTIVIRVKASKFERARVICIMASVLCVATRVFSMEINVICKEESEGEL